MAAKAKVLNKTTLDADKYSEIRSLANKLIEAIYVYKNLEPHIKRGKESLSQKCKEIFIEDLEQGEVNGNHNFSSEKGDLTVNFRLTNNADITQYRKTLILFLENYYDYLFEETTEIDITSSRRTRANQFQDYPGIFRLKLKESIRDKEAITLYNKMPHLFDLEIRDIKRYAEIFPQSVETTEKIYPKNGFIEKLGRIESSIKKRVLNVLKNFFEYNIETAIKS